MRVTLLGTGSADGWPNPFCRCASCEAERSAGRSRHPSSAAVDGVIVIDCGPASPAATTASGGSLDTVEHVLITHGHPDHLDPAFLLTRHWARSATALHVWGPAHAIDLCRHWIAREDPVQLHVVEPGEVHVLPTAVGSYTVQVLPAAHSSGIGDLLADEAVLFVLADPTDDRLLYATDTGPLPASTIEQIPQGLALLLVDETFGDTFDHGTGHLDLGTLPPLVGALRKAGAVTSSTRILVTHLSHHNPPTPRLRDRLSRWGIEVPDDLDVVDTSGPAAVAPRRTLVLGGARSGKSTYAESVAATWAAPVVYVATSGQRPEDPEWVKRVTEHRARRPSAWTTIETLDIASVLAGTAAQTTVLVDCVTLWLTGVLDSLDAWNRVDAAADVSAEVMLAVGGLIEAMQASAADVVLVSNEVGWGVVPTTPSGRLFRDLMGRANAELARACDRTILVVAGRGVPLHELGAM